MRIAAISPVLVRNPLVAGILAAIAVGLSVGVCVRLLGVSRRWEWWFSSPNDLGAIAAIMLVLGIGMAPRLVRKGGGGWLAVVVGCGSGGVLLAALVGSCSRGGWLAALLGLLLLVVIAPGLRRRMGLAAVVAILVAIAVVPRAHGRLAVAAGGVPDGSLQARMELWTAATAMIADRPAGWGADHFGEICESWYLPRYRGVHLGNPLNDALLIATEKGLWAAWVFLAAGVALVAGLCARARADRMEGMAAGLAAGLACVLVAGSVNCLIRPYGVQWYLVPLVLLGTAVLIRPVPSGTGGWHLRGALLSGACSASVLVAMAWWWGALEARALPWLPVGASAWPQAVPRSGLRAPPVLVVRAHADDDATICRLALRPLVAAGLAAGVVADDDVRLPAVIGGLAVVALREATPAIAVAVAGGQLPPPRALVLLDWTGAGAPSRGFPCPVLALCGSSQAALPDAALAALHAGRAGGAALMAKVPLCWPRHFHAFAADLAAWVSDPAGRGPAPGRVP